jgi:hypothetical protein
MVGERRSCSRQVINSPIYVSLGPSSGGLLCDLSEGGLAIDLLARPASNLVVQVEFDLPDIRDRIEALAQISWTDNSARRAGVEFVDLSGTSRQEIRDWILVQNVSECSGADFAAQPDAEEPQQIGLSLTQGEIEVILSDHEQLIDAQATLTQVNRLPKSELSEQTIGSLRIFRGVPLIGLALGLIAMLGTLFLLGILLMYQQSLVRATSAANKEPARLSKDSEASIAVAPAALKTNPRLDIPLIRRGAILLQVAALTQEQDALALAKTLQQRNFSAFVLMPSSDRYYRVQVGPYPDAESARLAKRRLAKEGFEAIVKR